MTKIKTLTALAAGAIVFSTAATSVQAQTPYGSTSSQTQGTSQQDAFGAILGALFGANSSSLDADWIRGRRPLNTGRAQFETRLTTDVRSGALSSTTAMRLRADYDSLVQTETQYAADGRFTTQERSDLNQRYTALTQRVNAGNYGDEADRGASVAEGRADFEARVTAAVTARRLTRTEATRLRADYAALVQTEATYSRDGLTTRERDDLEAQLDALDARVGDGPAYGGGGSTTPLPNRTRLANIDAALSTGERSGTINRTEAADIRVELGDLTRLEAAYARTSPSRDDTDYLVRRLGELEVRARVSTRR